MCISIESMARVSDPKDLSRNFKRSIARHIPNWNNLIRQRKIQNSEIKQIGEIQHDPKILTGPSLSLILHMIIKANKGISNMYDRLLGGRTNFIDVFHAKWLTPIGEEIALGIVAYSIKVNYRTLQFAHSSDLSNLDE